MINRRCGPKTASFKTCNSVHTPFCARERLDAVKLCDMQLIVSLARQTCNAVKQLCWTVQLVIASTAAALALSQPFHLVMCVGAACKAHLVPLVCIRAESSQSHGHLLPREAHLSVLQELRRPWVLHLRHTTRPLQALPLLPCQGPLQVAQ